MDFGLTCCALQDSAIAVFGPHVLSYAASNSTCLLKPLEDEDGSKTGFVHAHAYSRGAFSY